MPGLRGFLDRSQGDRDHERELPSEKLPIHLPSSLAQSDREIVCVHDLIQIEDRLRYGQACDALEDLRRQLRMRTFTIKFKARQIAGQGGYTRVRTLQDQIESRIRAARARYCTARDALFALRGAGSWEDTLQVLKAEDIRALNERTLTAQEKEAEERARQLAGIQEEEDPRSSIAVRAIGIVDIGERRRQLSWIWYQVTAAEVEQDGAGTLHDGMFIPVVSHFLLTSFNWTGIRLEWAKCRARAERSREELFLLEEEMRRVLEFCKWRADWWDREACCRPTAPPAVREGLSAYAAEQADIERKLAHMWEEKWRIVRARARIALDQDAADVADEMNEVGPEIEVELEEEEDDLRADDD